MPKIKVSEVGEKTTSDVVKYKKPEAVSQVTKRQTVSEGLRPALAGNRQSLNPVS
jgi:hypothetical protein